MIGAAATDALCPPPEAYLGGVVRRAASSGGTAVRAAAPGPAGLEMEVDVIAAPGDG